MQRNLCWEQKAIVTTYTPSLTGRWDALCLHETHFIVQCITAWRIGRDSLCYLSGDRVHLHDLCYAIAWSRIQLWYVVIIQIMVCIYCYNWNLMLKKIKMWLPNEGNVKNKNNVNNDSAKDTVVCYWSQCAARYNLNSYICMSPCYPMPWSNWNVCTLFNVSLYPNTCWTIKLIVLKLSPVNILLILFWDSIIQRILL